jgi:hypothetical protein
MAPSSLSGILPMAAGAVGGLADEFLVPVVDGADQPGHQVDGVVERVDEAARPAGPGDDRGLEVGLLLSGCLAVRLVREFLGEDGLGAGLERPVGLAAGTWDEEEEGRRVAGPPVMGGPAELQFGDGLVEAGGVHRSDGRTAPHSRHRR